MIGGLSSQAQYSGVSLHQSRPDFGALDSNQSGGLSVDELKSGLSNGSFGSGPAKGGPGAEGGPPPPPPGGGQGGPGAGQSGQGSSVAARILEGALELLSSDETASSEEADAAVQSLFATMDVDGDGSITDGEFHAFGASVGGPPPGAQSGQTQGQGTQAASAALALYNQTQGFDAFMSLTSELTQLRL